MSDFEAAHAYFKLVFSGKNPMTKKYYLSDFPDVNKLLVKQIVVKKDIKK
jgi:hypothetical protein